MTLQMPHLNLQLTLYNNYLKLLQMASVIKNLILQYKNKVKQQNQWSITSKSKQQETATSKKIGQYFLSLIVTMLLDESGISANNEKEIQKNKYNLLKKVEERHKEVAEVIERVFGVFLIELMKKDQKFSRIYQELDLLFEPEQQGDDETYDVNQDEEDQSNFYSSIGEKSISMSQMSLVKLIQDQSFMSYNESPFDIDHQHQKIVNQYISKLSAPQTQLSYMCQHFGWRLSFKENTTESGSFEVNAEIDFEFKNFKKQLAAKAQFKNKRMARLLSAAKILRNIYISFPEIWKIYNKIKHEKSLIIPQDEMNSNFIKEAIKVDRVEVVKMPKVDNFQQELKRYLDEIQSFKAEMNVLLQQIPGAFDHPKMEKMPWQNKWKVQGKLIVKEGAGRVGREYVELEVSANSKAAEEAVAKKLLTDMYSENKEILQLMSMLKKKKGFKT